jgi:hypothetical protein
MKFLRSLFGPPKKTIDYQMEYTALRMEMGILLDQMRQIEWRLAMCRNVALDVNIAHGIAARALEGKGGPYPDTSALYQRYCAEVKAGRYINVR